MANETQSWAVGQAVKVGFMVLIPRRRLVALGDWILSNKEGTQLYLFTRYNGCRKLSIDEAADYIQIDADTLKCREHNKRVIVEEDQAKKASINALFAA